MSKPAKRPRGLMQRLVYTTTCEACTAGMKVLSTRGQRRRLECTGCRRRATAKGEKQPERA